MVIKVFFLVFMVGLSTGIVLFELSSVDDFKKEQGSGNVVVQTEQKLCVCGRSFTLNCKLTRYITVAWMIGNDVTPIAKCIKDSCKVNPKYDKKYSLTYDLEKQIFSLQVIKVTEDDNGRIFVCSDGSDTDSWILSVKEYEPMLTEDTESGTLTASSGCWSYGKNDISVKWIKIDSNGGESAFYPTHIQQYETNCSNNTECGNRTKVQYSETINKKPSASGKTRLRIEVVYGVESIKSAISSKRYAIDEGDGAYFVPIILGVGCLIHVIIFIICHTLKRRNKVKKRPQGLGGDIEADKQSAIKSGHCDIENRLEEAEHLLVHVIKRNISQRNIYKMDEREYFRTKRIGSDMTLQRASHQELDEMKYLKRRKKLGTM